MASNLDYSQLVQSYFDNEMSVEERLDFEQLIERDPMLKEEFNLQNDIIDGIRAHRAEQLKAQLNQVPVGGIVWTTGLRWAAITTGLAVVAGLGYYFFVPALPASYSEVDFGSGVVLELTDTQYVPMRPVVQGNLPAYQATPTDPAPQAEPNGPVEQQASVVSSSPTVAGRTTAAPETAPEATAQNTIAASPMPTVSIPEFMHGNSTAEGPEVNADHVPGASFVERNRETRQVEMEVMEADRRHNFHYQFFSSKLYLYGDFEDKIYEIIEFNNAEGREFYFYFDQKFYPIQQGQRDITDLEAITDSDLHNRLERYRQSNLR